ncbi:bacteriohemerythrin [Solemya velesiana gill symbiont]|uniref:Hemerythrin-like domain-containing protein n=1 Tax=Solemya velesiana gill symbiont TaxID=1918948 RepID=A0A1T2KXL2_9GAMM|nr:bacteriohemerythrin [Solemya velesiana gill symbiont]OOZ37585.1 hypothetical protein BOW51_01875 [Solemya velesiana gill symbiont]
MTDFMHFNTRMALGISELDEEHMALVTLLNRLAESVQSNPEIGSQEAHELLIELERETKSHFQNEEAFMAKNGFTELREHQREHAMLHAELMQFMRELENGSARLDIVLLQQLREWLVGHIATTDKEFADF